ncbi:MAG TPA: DUF4381 domain-containing protein [Dokdonella sp.]|uniref:DUF4381 domain-containing protein n=1 Tax=Dokdonella sp. TaxID=2291710 RepID=UPI0025BD2CB0|nr:DUF4381 domain-containing protein [Dokdonella sp.]MBX3690725.1 DUF4381 domain-containing protein [Dokdonella sp.]MCW5566868.1 DUF4381 domain-containing protein [Dokdonella sp.]HNR91190.1 DUF4381 domain-containing protein [Dokdonella sp.]
MNANGPVLRDIHLPADPSWWPPAPGWWLLAAIGLAVIAFGIWRIVHATRRRRWRNAVIGELDAIARRHAEGGDAARLAAELSILLRRAARLVDARATTLQGDDWLAFLDAQLDTDAFTRGAGHVLADAPWQRAAAFDTDAVLALVRRWLVRVVEREPVHA